MFFSKLQLYSHNITTFLSTHLDFIVEIFICSLNTAKRQKTPKKNNKKKKTEKTDQEM